MWSAELRPRLRSMVFGLPSSSFEADRVRRRSASAMLPMEKWESKDPACCKSRGMSSIFGASAATVSCDMLDMQIIVLRDSVIRVGIHLGNEEDGMRVE